MKIYTIEARDSALFRDARPFIGSAGAVSMPVPWPGTIAGLLRTHSAPQDVDWATYSDEVVQFRSAGPWLAELSDDDQIVEHFLPAPADAVFFPDDAKVDDEKLSNKKLVRVQLRPEDFNGALSDMPTSHSDEHTLLPVLLAVKDADLGKPKTGPKWWSWSQYRQWLASPSSREVINADVLGVADPIAEERAHVGINAETRSADDGALFLTSMRRFVMKGSSSTGGSFRRFALAACFDARVDAKNAVVALGGERRSSSLRRSDAALFEAASTTGATRLRVVLVTPALFDDGWRPSAAAFGGGKLVAAIVPRPSAVSGWDFKAKGPKASRYMVPAGAVYWVDFASADAAQAFAQAKHMQSISDQEQDQLDGYGLVVIGRGE